MKRHRLGMGVALALAVACVPLAQRDARAGERLPNFVVIFIDDMGYGDIGPFGSKQNSTPELDRMAAEGMKLTSFYVASPVCTPSRAALLTGCYPQRVGLNRGSGHIVLFPGDKHGLHPNEITMAEVLKEKGYATGCFGKWHLGDQPGFLPTDQGFDTYYGIPYSNDMWPGLKRRPFPDKAGAGRHEGRAPGQGHGRPGRPLLRSSRRRPSSSCERTGAGHSSATSRTPSSTGRGGRDRSS